MNGHLYLIPTPLGDYPPQQVLTPSVLALLPKIEVFEYFLVRGGEETEGMSGSGGE